MKTLRSIGIAIALLIPAISAATTPSVASCCESHDCCPGCPFCPSHLHK